MSIFDITNSVPPEIAFYSGLISGIILMVFALLSSVYLIKMNICTMRDSEIMGILFVVLSLVVSALIYPLDLVALHAVTFTFTVLVLVVGCVIVVGFAPKLI